MRMTATNKRTKLASLDREQGNGLTAKDRARRDNIL
jgi:hypothetical protein